jgi:hypothetical protein
MSFFAMPTKPVVKKPTPGKPQAVKPAQKNVVQKKPAPDRVENLAKAYLAQLREVDVTFEKGTAVLEKYRAKYPELVELDLAERGTRLRPD